MSSSADIKAKESDLVNLLCSVQGEPPITFNWEKDLKTLESFMEKEQPHRSTLLVVKIKDESSFGNYTCHIRDRFQSTTTYTILVQKAHTILVQKETTKGNYCNKSVVTLLINLVLTNDLRSERPVLLISFQVVKDPVYLCASLK